MDAKTLRMLATMVLLASSAFTMLAEAKPHCNGRKFKDNPLLSDRIRSVLEIMQFHAKLNVGETVTKMLEKMSMYREKPGALANYRNRSASCASMLRSKTSRGLVVTIWELVFQVASAPSITQSRSKGRLPAQVCLPTNLKHERFWISVTVVWKKTISYLRWY